MPIMKDNGIDITRNFMDTSSSNGVKSFDPYVKITGFDPNS